MARPKATVQTFKLPTPLPDGLQTVKVEYKEGEETFTLDVLAPERTGAGVIAWQNLVNGLEGETDGNADVADRILATHVQTVKSAHQLARKNNEKVNTLAVVPSAPGTRTLDPMDAYLARQRAFIAEHRRPPTEKETSAMYAEVFGPVK